MFSAAGRKQSVFSSTTFPTPPWTLTAPNCSYFCLSHERSYVYLSYTLLVNQLPHLSHPILYQLLQYSVKNSTLAKLVSVYEHTHIHTSAHVHMHYKNMKSLPSYRCYSTVTVIVMAQKQTYIFLCKIYVSEIYFYKSPFYYVITKWLLNTY